MAQGANWVGLRTGKDYRSIPTHTMTTSLPLNVSRALPLFHAIIGCDTVSSFHGKGKKTAWEMWKKQVSLLKCNCRKKCGTKCICHSSGMVLLSAHEAINAHTTDLSAKNRWHSTVTLSNVSKILCKRLNSSYSVLSTSEVAVTVCDASVIFCSSFLMLCVTG